MEPLFLSLFLRDLPAFADLSFRRTLSFLVVEAIIFPNDDKY